MKQRFSSLDVKVITRELQSSVVNLRVSNIYDLSSRIFLLKLAKPDHRRQLIIDSGFRCHTTQYSRTTATTPSPFVSRLRKHLKSRRITSVAQIGTDRIIDIALSDGAFHLFLEFFAGGNIILTDREFVVLAVFRPVSASEGQEEEVKVGLRYRFDNKQNVGGVSEISGERVRAVLERGVSLFGGGGGGQGQEDSGGAGEEKKNNNKKSKAKKKAVDILRRALSNGFPEYPPLLLDHAFAVRGVDSGTSLEQVLGDEELLLKVKGVLEEAASVSNGLVTDQGHPGYIVAKEDNRTSSAPEGETGETGETTEEASKKPKLIYEDFHPFKPRQFEIKSEYTILEFDNFNATVDEYFSSLESQRLETRLTDREEAAKRKLDTLRQDHEGRIGSLEHSQELHIRKAEAIGDNIFRVQEAMEAVNGLIAQGMDWVEIGRLVEMEQGRGNPVARLIKLPLKLHENTITLLLGEAGEEQDEGDELFSESEEEEESEDEEREEAQNAAQGKEPSVLTVDIDLGLSPWANATQFYEQKKSAAVKQQKTVQSSAKALKSHEKKVTEDLKRTLKQEKQVLRPSRKPFWFEKFFFFVSSEGHLVLGGRDGLQSEMLYQRHLRKGDIFVHADLKDATPLIVKNRQGTPDAPISPSTLSQAGNFCVATSSAWDSKAVMSAWWVQASQVSKSAGPGGILPAGEFVIKGEKNFLAPSQLVLGLGVMFQVSQESVRNHKSQLFDGAVTVGRAAGGDEKTGVENGTQDAVQREEPTEPSQEAKEHTEEDKNEQETGSDDEERADNVTRENPLQPKSSETPGAGKDTEEGSVGSDSGSEDGQNDEVGKEGSQKDGDAGQTETPSGKDEAVTEDNENNEPAASRPENKRHLSARERRMLRKGKPVEPSSETPQPKQTTTTTTPEPTKSAAPSTTPTMKLPKNQPTPKQNNPPKHGKKALKNKKAAAKYADQDEEERELALRLLGANNAKTQKSAADTAVKADRAREAELQKQRRRAQHDRAAEAERKRQALFEQGQGGTGTGAGAEDDYDEETAAAEAADLSWLPALIGTPVPEDEILAAIPVCAPWGALGKYKYKVKLQPGTVKKGKAVKEILGRWVAEMTTGKVRKEFAEEVGVGRGEAEKLRSREGELVRGWKDTEIVNCVPVSKLRIMTAGVGGGGGDSKGKGKGGGGKEKGGKKK